MLILIIKSNHSNQGSWKTFWSRASQCCAYVYISFSGRIQTRNLRARTKESHIFFVRLNVSWQSDESGCWILSYEIHQNWDLFMQIQHNNNPNIPIISSASYRFLACEPKQLQHKLFAQQMQSLQAHLLNTSSPSDKLRLHSCSGTGAAAFLRVPASYLGCFFTNRSLSSR